MEFHLEKTRYNTGREESGVGKESGEEDNGSQNRKNKVVLHSTESQQGEE